MERSQKPHVPYTITEPERQKQEEYAFEANLGYKFYTSLIYAWRQFFKMCVINQVFGI